MEVIFTIILSSLLLLAGFFIIVKYLQDKAHNKSLLYFKFYKQRLDVIDKNLQIIGDDLKKLHTRIDNIFVIDKPEENAVVKQREENEDLSETNMFTVPKSLKFEVEGDPEDVPPEFNLSN